MENLVRSMFIMLGIVVCAYIVGTWSCGLWVDRGLTLGAFIFFGCALLYGVAVFLFIMGGFEYWPVWEWAPITWN